MKCYTLAAQRYTPRAGMVLPVHPKAYPLPSFGIEIDRTHSHVLLSWEVKVPVSPELLRQPPSTGFLERKGPLFRVFRASVARNGAGENVIIPELPDDTQDALLLLDIGSGHGHQVRYEVDEDRVIARSPANDSWGSFAHEILLVRLKPFDTVEAIRSRQRYVVFGKFEECERLRVSFDGENIFYNNPKA